MIAIMSAMKEEVQQLLDHLQNKQTIRKGKRTYYKGILFNTDVVIVFSRWGKVAAAATTVQLINDYNPSEIIFTGVAGGIKDDISIGDIVVGKQLYQYDMDASPLYAPFVIPILNKESFETSNSANLKSAVKSFIVNYNAFIDPEIAQAFHIAHPAYFEGDIASGDQFISEKAKIHWLNQAIPSALCVEMEGAAVAQICFEYNIDFSIIRVISDKANDNATIDFPKFAEKIASNYALGIVKYYFNAI